MADVWYECSDRYAGPTVEGTVTERINIDEANPQYAGIKYELYKGFYGDTNQFTYSSFPQRARISFAGYTGTNIFGIKAGETSIYLIKDDVESEWRRDDELSQRDDALKFDWRADGLTVPYVYIPFPKRFDHVKPGNDETINSGLLRYDYLSDINITDSIKTFALGDEFDPGDDGPLVPEPDEEAPFYQKFEIIIADDVPSVNDVTIKV